MICPARAGPARWHGRWSCNPQISTEALQFCPNCDIIEHMFDGEWREDPRPWEGHAGRLAGEDSVGYSAGAEGAVPRAARSVQDALDTIAEALDGLAAVDLDVEHDAAVTDAVLRVQPLLDRLVGQQLRLVGAFDRRGLFAEDAAASATSWLASRWRLDHGEINTKVQAARRLEALPRLREELESGAVSFSHVREVTRSATPRRMEAVTSVEQTLVELARKESPRTVRVAMSRIRDLVDPDGTDDPPPLSERPGGVEDERRGLDLSSTIDGLWILRATLDPLCGELFATLLDAYSQPDPEGTPEEAQRTPAQRRHDAFSQALGDLARWGRAPTKHGQVPHVLLMVDLLALLGLVDQADRPHPRLRFTGATTLAVARQLFAHAVRWTAVLTLGPWRVVGFGSTRRLLPDWLRPLLQMIHHRCRGPDCDRPATWADAHHVRDWHTNRNTDFNDTIPLCRAHHGLVTARIWSVDYDPDTGRCTWTGPRGQTIVTHPPTP